MLKYFRLVNWGMLITIMVISGVATSPKVLFTAENFSIKERKLSTKADYSSNVEKQIRSGFTSTADMIVDYHPRIWLKGNWDWDAYEDIGSHSWRMSHKPPMGKSDPANDSQQYEFLISARGGDRSYGDQTSDYKRWYLRLITAAEASARPEWGFPVVLPSTSKRWNKEHTEDEYLAEARLKLLNVVDENIRVGYDYLGATGIIKPCVAYDWLVDRKYSDGVTPVLSNSDREELQNKIIAVAEDMRSHALGSGFFFDGFDISRYCYVMAGLALYEPSGQGISASNNAKAKQYLDEFDEYWVGNILPVLNEQGGTGGWHLGYDHISSRFFSTGATEMFNYYMAKLLFAHYTATGRSFEESVYSTGVLKYTIEFQNHMVYPNGDAGVGEFFDHRYRWIAPMFATSRRRFSSDPEQQWLGELNGWFRNEIAPDHYVDAGSYCYIDQLIWEEKWPNPRSADELGCGTRHFAKLGWVAMRSGFSSSDDLAALFISQRYHWSDMDLYAQNSFHIMRKGWLIEGNNNTIYIDDQYQRSISGFPTIADGLEAYSPGSVYDVGPGIKVFESTQQYDYIFGDATNAYDNNKLEKFTRGLVWLKDSNTFIIFDRVVTKDAGIKKSWFVDPGATPQTEADGLVKISNGSGALWVKRILPEQATETISNSIFEVTPSQPVKEDYFLFVMQAVDAGFSKDSPEVMADEAEIITQGNKIGVSIDSWEILFSKSGTGELWVNGTFVSVELNLFEASVKEDVVMLEWQTSSETNNFGFEIERSSNSVNYQKIGFVAGHGTTTTPQSYQFPDRTVEEGKYYYRLKQLDADGSFEYSSSVEITVNFPNRLNLFQNYPNPFNPSTGISYSLPCNAYVNLSICDVSGRTLKTLVQERQPAGHKTIIWNGRDLYNVEAASGLYFYRLNVNGFSISKKMLLIR